METPCHPDLPARCGRRPVVICGGIDLGGTKIEARLFAGPGAETTAMRRIPTPKQSYGALLDALLSQIEWLVTTSGQDDLAVGVAAPGTVDPESGRCFASNIPATGHALGHDLGARLGRAVPLVNDAMAFAYSEARGGAGAEHRSVLGLILGTGIGCGHCLDGAMPHRLGGLGLEIGHVGAPARALARHDLPLLPCGCGARGCFETYISGTGLSNLAEIRTGRRPPAEALAADPEMADVLSIWVDLAAECLSVLQLAIAPDIVVLGGGLSKMSGIADRLVPALAARGLGDAALPAIALARHGDSSGARGAALLAAGARSGGAAAQRS